MPLGRRVLGVGRKVWVQLFAVPVEKFVLPWNIEEIDGTLQWSRMEGSVLKGENTEIRRVSSEY